MRERVALLLIVGIAFATSAFSHQQRSCELPLPTASSSDTSDDGEAWDGKPAFFQNAIWTVHR